MSENFKTIKIEMVEGTSNLTPNASLLLVDKFFKQSGLSKIIDEAIGARKSRGASDSAQIKSLVMSQICGGETVEAQKYLRSRVEMFGISVPSVTAARAYLESFNNIAEDAQRGMGKSFIPAENEHLSGFAAVHAHMLQVAYNLAPMKEITLDQDATFIQTTRSDACFNYKGERSFEAFNTYCPEYDVMVGTRYSDGNVTPGFEQLGEVKRVLSLLPEGVKKVKLRSDSAGYQTELMKYCARGENERFGVIDFAISCPVREEFKAAAKQTRESEWKPIADKDGIPTGQECAEVIYAPRNLCGSKKDPEIRFFAVREEFHRRSGKKGGCGTEKNAAVQKELGLEITEEIIEELVSAEEGLKDLHLTLMSGKIYKVFGVASNILDKTGEEIILWHRGRCGKSEQAHDILKNDLGGGHVPSYLFGVNAAWWNIAVLAMNVNSVIKRYFLPFEYEGCRFKTLRHIFYTLSGKVVQHARKTVLKIWSQDVGAWLLFSALSRLDKQMPGTA
jgi:hypothetical protein